MIKNHSTFKHLSSLTACGNLITDYPGNVSTDTAGLETTKLHWNITTSSAGAKDVTIDISNMHPNTPLDRCEHMRFHLKDLPPEVIEQHNLLELADANGWCCCEVRKAAQEMPC